MRQISFKIENIPALLIGEESRRVYLYVHGKHGQKEEALEFARTACPNGWQVLGIDLPKHGERRNEETEFMPWEAVRELTGVMEYMKSRWEHIALRATSIGAWFSLLSFNNEAFENALFVSPILNMEQLISDMMKWASVTPEQLRREGEIETDFGETLSWDYLQYVLKHPLLKWQSPTHILYTPNDPMIRRETVDDFADRFSASVTVMENGEHWFHTEEQLDFLHTWTEPLVSRYSIRAITPEDYAGRAYVHYQAWQESYTGLMDSRVLAAHTLEHCRAAAEQHPENTLVVLDHWKDSKVAGFATYVPQARPFVSVPDASEISALYLLREYQGQGLGRRLLNACLAHLPQPRAALYVLQGNDKAVGFYEHCGFRFTGHQRTDEINGGTVTELEMVFP